jgi:ADP-heptose:LPS heptosyltransferase
LPLAFGSTLETIPVDVPYLTVDESAAARWRQLLGDAEGLKVGLVWAGNPQHAKDRHRSIALKHLVPLFATAGVRWFSLQVGERKAALTRLPAGTIVDLSDHLTDFAETAGAVSALDLVITIDTSVAHVAGALGKPTWVLLPFAADWRWLIDRTDSPWYPTARLFRQPAMGDWASVVDKVASALRDMCEPRTAAASRA